MTVNPYTDRFWTTLKDGRFLINECQECNESFFPPSPVCPACHSESVCWVESSGEGTIHSYSEQHVTPPGFPEKYTLGTIRLTEGPFVLGRVVGPLEEIEINAEVVVEPVAADEEFGRLESPDRPFFRFRVS